jgi:hypothetical protein
MQARTGADDYSAREEEVLKEVCRRLAPIGPEVVLLFGSRARGHALPDSDFDLVVVMDLPSPKGPRTPAVRRLLRGLGVPFDIIVFTPSEWHSRKAHPQSLAHAAATTGKVLLGSP